MLTIEEFKRGEIAIECNSLKEAEMLYTWLICENGRKCVGEENRNFALDRFKPGINFKFFSGEFESCQSSYFFDDANRGAISYKQLLVSECEIDKNSLIDLLDI